MSDHPHVLISTPCYGTLESSSVALGYHLAVAGLMAAGGTGPHYSLAQSAFGCDLVRARSRMVGQFLRDTKCTHLLFWDADVVTSAAQADRLISALLATGHGFVGCTYPKKRIHWDNIPTRRHDGLPGGRGDAEVYAYDYPYALGSDRTVRNGCLAVNGLPFGFTLISRAVLETMVEWFGEDRRGDESAPTHEARSPSLEFLDVVGDVRQPTVALFQLAIVDGKLLGEDYSFAHRWRGLGGSCHLYVGPDCELGHVGGHVYRGRRAGYVR